MQIFKFENLTLVCDSRSTRVGFAHDCNGFINDFQFCDKASIHYYNRTWECYTYQSVILKYLNECLEFIYNRTKENYKYVNKLSRVTPKSKNEIWKLFQENKNAILLQRAKEHFGNKYI